jgi:hypothetical protein
LYWKEELFQEFGLVGEAAQKLAFVHPIFKGLSPIDEDNRDFVVELTAEFRIGIHVNLAPYEAATARQLGKTLFDHFTEVTPLARVHDNIGEFWHAREILARGNKMFPAAKGEGIRRKSFLGRFGGEARDCDLDHSDVDAAVISGLPATHPALESCA